MKSNMNMLRLLLIILLLIESVFTMEGMNESDRKVQESISSQNEETYIISSGYNGIRKEWDTLLRMLKAIQPKRFNQAVESYGLSTSSEALKILLKDGVKTAVISTSGKENLRSNLVRWLKPHSNLLPESFFDDLVVSEKFKSQTASYEEIVQKIKGWIVLWEDLFSYSKKHEETEAKTFDTSDIWDLEQISWLKIKTPHIDTHSVKSVFEEASKYKFTKINASGMRQILNVCVKSSKLSLPLEVWENLLIVQILEHTYLTFERYFKIVNIKIMFLGSLFDNVKESALLPIIGKWETSIEDYKIKTGNYLNLHILEIILKQFKYLEQVMEEELKKLVTFKEMVNFVYHLIEYGEQQEMRIPALFFSQVFFDSQLTDTMIKESYIRRVLSRLAQYKSYWSKALESSPKVMLLHQHSPKTAFDIEKDFDVDVSKLRLFNRESYDVVLIPSNQKDTKEAGYKIKLFKDDSYLQELYITSVLQSYLNQGMHLYMRSKFLLPQGYIKRPGNQSILGKYEYGLVYQGTPFTLDKLIKSSTDIPVELIQAIMYQLFVSVGFLHDIGILHMDLKPSNILISMGNTSQDLSSMSSIERFEFYKKNAHVCITEFERSTYNRSDYSEFEWPVATRGNEYIHPFSRSPLAFMPVSSITTADEIWSLGMIYLQLCTRQSFLHEAWKIAQSEDKLLYSLLPTAIHLKTGKTDESSLRVFPSQKDFSGSKNIKHYARYKKGYEEFWDSLESQAMIGLYSKLDQLKKFTVFWQEKPFKEQAFNLLKALLDLNDDERPDATELLEHPFFIYT